MGSGLTGRVQNELRAIHCADAAGDGECWWDGTCLFAEGNMNKNLALQNAVYVSPVQWNDVWKRDVRGTCTPYRAKSAFTHTAGLADIRIWL